MPFSSPCETPAFFNASSTIGTNDLDVPPARQFRKNSAEGGVDLVLGGDSGWREF
jgi:hypothetical protein